ncbi:MAG: TonB-dependent receptor, partial [Proteobacteria bacterium]|nr:TonB-dependent receptor [Pseudomonadota bacterium]
QDLSFKLNFPTKAGEFSFWGVGGSDFGKKNEELVLDPLEREFEDDLLDNEFGFNIGATGITHKLNLGENTLLQSSVASSINDSYWDEERLNTFDELQPEKSVRNMTGSISASTIVNHKFSRKHSIRTGILHHQHFYDLKIREAVDHQLPFNTSGTNQLVI